MNATHTFRGLLAATLCGALLGTAACAEQALYSDMGATTVEESAPPQTNNGQNIGNVNNPNDPNNSSPNAPGTEPAEALVENDWVHTDDEVLSTFSADVDTASYTMMRRALADGFLPDPSTIRVEEYINYFKYDDPRPVGEEAFAVTVDAAPSEFGEGLHLMRIGVQAAEVPLNERDPVNLVFLIDVSGSMSSPDKLPLVQFTLKNLIEKLQPTDTLGIVVYAGADGVVLEPTPVTNKSVILDAIDNMRGGGSTNGEAGIRRAYTLAQQAFRDDGVNRVVLATDGDFNVGLTGAPLVELIEDVRDDGVFLSILGYGAAFDDEQLENLSNAGNGNYAFIDSPNEALRVTGENLVSTLQVVAKDVKLQVEFNPVAVSKFRLIGYENRLLEHDEFDDDTVDAGDIGAGHHVTALYEVEFDANALTKVGTVEGPVFATVNIRHKKPTGDTSLLQAFPFAVDAVHADFAEASDDLKFAAATAEFAEILRGSTHTQGERFGAIRAIVVDQIGESEVRSEFAALVAQAEGLMSAPAAE